MFGQFYTSFVNDPFCYVTLVYGINPDFEPLTLIAVPTYKVDIKYAKIHCCALKKEAQKPTKAGTKAENFLHSQLQSRELCCAVIS